MTRAASASISAMGVLGVHLVLYSGLAALSPVTIQTDGAMISVGLAAGLILASISDLRWRIIPDEASLGLVLCGLGVVAWFRPEALGQHALVAAAWYILLAASSALYQSLRGRDGLGIGDAKLMAAVGAWLGLEGSISVLLYASIMGLTVILCVAVVRRVHLGRLRNEALAFGPFIAMATWIVWLYGPLP